MAVVAGNWKMNHGPRATEAYFQALSLPDNADAHEVLVFPPALSLSAAVSSPARDPRIRLGVQNVHWEDSGAYTGEISAGMARESGASFVLVGHSERRHVFGETDEEVGLKVGACLRHGLVPVVCVGETLTQRRAGEVEAVILRQLDAAMGVLRDDPGRFLLAYEPVWAIGTGETATPAHAAAAHGALRSRLEERLDPGRAAGVSILYGGSVKLQNVAELLAAPEVDGVLVGGACLDPSSFASLVAAAG